MNRLTKLLLGATLIPLVVGIPVSTVYWWPQFWGPQFSLATGYWDQWIHGLKIASAVLAALWILDLILWMKAKREESKFYRNRAINKSSPKKYAGGIPTFGSTAPPRGRFYYFGPDGPGTTNPPPPPNASQPVAGEPIASEPIPYVVPEPLRSQSPFEHGADFLRNQEINRLVEEGRITIKEAESIRQQTKDMDFSEMEMFFSAIEHKAERERQEREGSLDSIRKKYGFDSKKFRF